MPAFLQEKSENHPPFFDVEPHVPRVRSVQLHDLGETAPGFVLASPKNSVGAYVFHVAPRSPAHHADIFAGDHILQVADVDVSGLTAGLFR